MNKKLIKISEFSELSKVSIKTLRHYDNLNIFVPTERLSNGVRLYDPDQFIDLKHILKFKKMGFSLTEIKSILKGVISQKALLKRERPIRSSIDS